MKKLYNGDVAGQEIIGRNGGHDGNRAVVRGPSMVAYSLDPEER